MKVQLNKARKQAGLKTSDTDNDDTASNIDYTDNSMLSSQNGSFYNDTLYGNSREYGVLKKPPSKNKVGKKTSNSKTDTIKSNRSSMEMNQSESETTKNLFTNIESKNKRKMGTNNITKS